jgi:hypothetical protein
MKYIITENQNERLRMLMSELLENEFAGTNVVCEIKVFNVDDGVFNYKIHAPITTELSNHLIKRTKIKTFKVNISKSAIRTE